MMWPFERLPREHTYAGHTPALYDRQIKLHRACKSSCRTRSGIHNALKQRIDFGLCGNDVLEEFGFLQIHDRRGFTLIELLVVLVLIGFLSSLVFVAVTGGILRSEDARFVQAFRQNLVHARAASLGRGEIVRFLIDSEERVVSFEGGRRYKIPETIQVEGNGVAEVLPGVFAVFFYPDGSSSGGEIDLRWGDGSLERVTVDKLLGVVRMEHVAS